jgi:hypothetical protein
VAVKESESSIASGWDVGELEIFLLFLFGRDVFPKDDGLGVTPSSVVATKMLEPCISVGHGEADLQNTPKLPTWRAKCRWILCRKNTGYHAKDPKDSNVGGCTR